jgi:hypothetical protein
MKRPLEPPLAPTVLGGGELPPQLGQGEYLPVNKIPSPWVDRKNTQKKELSQTGVTSGFAKNIHSGKERANNSPKAPKNTS